MVTGAARWGLALLWVTSVGSGAGCRARTETPPRGRVARSGVVRSASVAEGLADAGAWVRRLEAPGRDRWQRPAWVVERLDLSPGEVVVDLGAGSGYFLPHLAQAVAPAGQVLALDVDPDRVRFLTERIDGEGLRGTSAALIAPDDPGLAPRSAHRILVVNTWHHLEDRARYAARLAAGLASGGAVFVIDFTRDSPIGPPREDRLPPRRVVSELERAGLAAEVIEAPLPHQYVVVGRKRR